MALQRYDVRGPSPHDGYVRRFWTPVNSPVRDACGRTIGALHHVSDVTSVVDPLLDDGHPPEGLTDDNWTRLVEMFASEVMAHEQNRLEVDQLRGALHSRVIIEQAKGVAMALRGIDGEDAFALLRHWARSSRVTLHSVAADVVRSLELPPPIVRQQGIADA